VAFFALFFLLLQPICAAYESHVSTPLGTPAATTQDAMHADSTSHGPGDSTPCCLEMRADAMASASPMAVDKYFAAAGLTVALPLAVPGMPELTSSYHSARGIPPPHPLSYHARSARIQR